MEMFSVMTPNPNISGVNPFKIKEMVLFHLTVWCHPYIYKGIDEMKLNIHTREGVAIGLEETLSQKDVITPLKVNIISAPIGGRGPLEQND